MKRLLTSLVARWRSLVGRGVAVEEVEPAAGYALWAASYPAQAHNVLMAVEEKAMLSLFPDLNGKTCLDLGCGSGRYLQRMKEAGAGALTGLDLSPEMLVRAEQLPFQVSLHLGRFDALPFENQCFDFICCGLGLGHEPQLAAALVEIARVLRPGGLFLYSDVHPFGTLAGWKRSFRQARREISIRQYLYLYSDHHRAVEQAGLHVTRVLEPLGGPGAPEAFQTVPVALVIAAVKPS